MERARVASSATSPDEALVWLQTTDRPAGRSVRPGARSVEKAPKNQANRILILGRLRELALYRAEVLRSHGFEVFTPETHREAIEIIEDGNFDVAILSYTLLDSEVQNFVERIRQCSPDCRVLAIAQTMQRDRRIEPDAVVLAENGPTELLSALRKLLPQR